MCTRSFQTAPTGKQFLEEVDVDLNAFSERLGGLGGSPLSAAVKGELDFTVYRCTY